VFQNTTYIKDGRQRVEFPGMVTIEQCDLRRTVLLNPPAKRYRVETFGADPTNQPAAPVQPQRALQQPHGGIITLTTTLTDTTERQTMFGLEARHIKTVITKQADVNACDKTPTRTEIDGWYVDLPKSAVTCSKPQRSEPPSVNECRDRVEAHVVGDASLGFPVKMVTTTITGESGKQESTTSNVEVTALEITKLDASLFEIPADYSAATSSAELMPSIANGASLEEALFGSTADGTGDAAPKKAGAIRIGVLEPVNKSARTLNTRMLRQDLVGKFTKAPYEALPLAGSSADAIQADAVRLSCDYILLGEIDEVKTSKPGKVGGLLKAASGGGPPAKDVHDVKAAYRLYGIASTASPSASGEVRASSSQGFSLGSALKAASFAGQLYMGFGMMRMMRGFGGMGYGMDPMSAIIANGSLGTAGMRYVDPRAMAMNTALSSMATGIAGSTMGVSGMPAESSDGEVYQTLSEALDNLAKAATAKLTPAK